MTTDVVVVGAGIAGVCTAWELARRGADVCLIDAGEVSGGTTGLGEGNVLCSDKDAGPELELALHGRAIYDELDAALGAVAQIRRKGALIVHPDAATWEIEPARLARLAAAGVRSQSLGPAEVRAMEPELTGDVLGASYFAEDLQCAPRAITRALARQLPRVVTGCRVESIDGSGVRTEQGSIAADAVVLAAGAWSGALARSAGLELPVEPRWGQLVQLAAPMPIEHKVVDGSYLVSVVDPGAELQVSTVIETTWGGDVLVGSSRARRGFSDAVDPAVTGAMLDRAARLMPGLRGRPVARAWSGLRPWLPDHRPAIGPSRAVGGLWVNTGHEGAGVALGPVSGRALAQALCGEPPLVDLAPFDPDRFT